MVRVILSLEPVPQAQREIAVTTTNSTARIFFMISSFKEMKK
jgi:hypothetical protein